MDAVPHRAGHLMHAQQLRSVVTIEQRGSGYDEAGQPSTTWTTFATVRGDVRHLSGTETIKADAVASVVKASVRVRWLEGIKAGMRLTVSGSVYEIRAVLPDIAGRRFVDIACETTNGY